MRAARIAESEHAPGWLSRPTLTGMTTYDFDQLLTAYQAHLDAHPPVSLSPRSHVNPDFGARTWVPQQLAYEVSCVCGMSWANAFWPSGTACH